MTSAGSTQLPVRVLIVDDSAFMRQTLSRMVASEPDFEVVGTAFDGNVALEKIAALDPDVVTLDLVMPGLDGLQTLRQIMNRSPRPVIMITSAGQDTGVLHEVMSAGAFACVPKQLSASSLDIGDIRPDLVAKIRTAALERRPQIPAVCAKKPSVSVRLNHASAASALAAVAIGASTGGPGALSEILPALPRDFPAPILIVQHMPPGFITDFAQRLNAMSALEVREAVDGEIPRPGVVYFASAGQHLVVRYDRPLAKILLHLESHPDDALHIPSVDVLMNSVATVYGSRAMGVILTGMGFDGAEGIAAIHRQGGITIGQNKETCAVYGMPRACAEAGILTVSVPLSQIASQMVSATVGCLGA